MCESCKFKYDLDYNIQLAKKLMIIAGKNIVIYQNFTGYNVVAEDCFKPEMGYIIKTIEWKE